jgi:LCP family protein required for cell wall assembly
MDHAQGAEAQAGRRLNGEVRARSGQMTAAPPIRQNQPVPYAGAGEAVRRRRRRRTPWYRRPVVIFLLILLLLVGGSLGAASMFVGDTLTAVQKISTPPPHVAGGVFGAQEGVEVDTGPAQAAVASDQRSSGGSSSSGGLWGRVKGAAKGVGGMTSGAAAAVGITKPAEPSSGVNILLMGVDARPGEAIDVGVRPDALMVLHLNPENGSCRVLAIPRDTRTELPGYGLTKINHALAVGGTPYERQVVEQFLGISIQHYGLIDFTGLTDLVDAVGGVTIDNDYAFSAGGVDFPLGPQHLDGKDALTFSRFRHGPDGDFGRVRRQQMVIRALVKQGASLNVVTELNRLLPALQAHTRTDLTVPEMIALAQKYGPTCSSSTLDMKELQGSVASFQDPMLHMELSYVVVDPKEVQSKVAWLLGKS